MTVKHAKKTFPCHVSPWKCLSARGPVYQGDANQSHRITQWHQLAQLLSGFNKRIGSSLQSYWKRLDFAINQCQRHPWARGMDFNFPIFLYFLLLFPTSSLACISVVKKTKADAVNAIANTLTSAAGIVLNSIPKVKNLTSLSKSWPHGFSSPERSEKCIWESLKCFSWTQPRWTLYLKWLAKA